MAQTSFEVDGKTLGALESLKKTYLVSSNAAVLKRALAIALILSRYADEDGNIHFLTRVANQKIEVIVSQRY
jgi:hypothetical protein